MNTRRNHATIFVFSEIFWSIPWKANQTWGWEIKVSGSDFIIKELLLQPEANLPVFLGLRFLCLPKLWKPLIVQFLVPLTIFGFPPGHFYYRATLSPSLPPHVYFNLFRIRVLYSQNTANLIFPSLPPPFFSPPPLLLLHPLPLSSPLLLSLPLFLPWNIVIKLIVYLRFKAKNQAQTKTDVTSTTTNKAKAIPKAWLMSERADVLKIREERSKYHYSSIF